MVGSDEQVTAILNGNLLLLNFSFGFLYLVILNKQHIMDVRLTPFTIFQHHFVDSGRHCHFISCFQIVSSRCSLLLFLKCL